MSDADITPVDVTREDQASINLFGRLNSELHYLRATATDLKKRLEHLEEAGNELMLADDEESARFLVGECFLHIDNDGAEERINQETTTVNSQLEKAEADAAKVMEEMNELKARLYSKFGRNINLDDDAED